MDYRELLKQYMDHVATEEGTTFVGQGMSSSWEKISPEGRAELEAIERELWSEEGDVL